MVTVPLSPAPGPACELLLHYLWAANLLVQGGLPDD
jgi:hypothetical protein